MGKKAAPEVHRLAEDDGISSQIERGRRQIDGNKLLLADNQKERQALHKKLAQARRLTKKPSASYIGRSNPAEPRRYCLGKRF
jgi:hypothetical protein